MAFFGSSVRSAPPAAAAASPPDDNFPPIFFALPLLVAYQDLVHLFLMAVPL